MSNMLTSITFEARAAKDPELSTNQQTGAKYVRLNVIQNKGYKDNEHTVCFSCFFYGGLGERLINAGVKKGNLLSIAGDFDSKEYMRKDPNDKNPNSQAKTYHDRSLEIKVYDWSYAPQNKSGSNPSNAAAPGNAQRQGMQAQGTPPAQNYPPAQYAAPQQQYQQTAPGQNYQQSAAQQGYPQQNGQSNYNYQQGSMNHQQPSQAPTGTNYSGVSNGFANMPQQNLPFNN